MKKSIEQRINFAMCIDAAALDEQTQNTVLLMDIMGLPTKGNNKFSESLEILDGAIKKWDKLIKAFISDKTNMIDQQTLLDYASVKGVSISKQTLLDYVVAKQAYNISKKIAFYANSFGYDAKFAKLQEQILAVK